MQDFFLSTGDDDFNSRPCGRGDLPSDARRRPAPISIHAPAGGATCRQTLDDGLHLFQFTPLREGRQRLSRGARACIVISIHAPAGGATAKGYKKRK